MTSLLIDTCTEQGVVLFFKGDDLLYLGNIPQGFSNSKYLMQEVQKGLELLSIAISDLEMIAVAVGPGSYTGIRVGVAVAKTLAYSASLPIVTLCSLDGFVPDQDGDFISLIDAKVSGAYYRFGNLESGCVSWKSEPQVKLLEEILELQECDRLVTPNSQRLSSKLLNLYPERSFTWVDCSPNVVHLISEARRKYQLGLIEEGYDFPLLYLRKTQAEIEKEGN